MAHSIDEETEVSSIEDIMNIVNAEYDGEHVVDNTGDADVNEDPADENTNVEPVETPADDTDIEPASEDYTPDFNYSIKGEELEFDDRFKTIVKTKEDEEYVRELLTKAGGLDSYKEKYSTVEADMKAEADARAKIEADFKEQQEFYKSLVDSRDSGDIRGVAKSIGLSDDALLQYALKVAAERELPEEDRVARENARQLQDDNQVLASTLAKQKADLEALTLHTQETSLKEQQAELIESQTNELSTTIESSYGDLKNALERVGLDIASEAVNVGRGITMSRADGKEPSIAEALEATAKKYEKLLAINTTPEPAAPRTRKQTIPTVGASSGNVVGTPISSLADIQKELTRLEQTKL